jgi:hypothetical protein
MYMQGETVPKESNHVRLHETLTDEWGVPQLATSVAFDDNDERMMRVPFGGRGDARDRRLP